MCTDGVPERCGTPGATTSDWRMELALQRQFWEARVASPRSTAERSVSFSGHTSLQLTHMQSISLPLRSLSTNSIRRRLTTRCCLHLGQTDETDMDPIMVVARVSTADCQD